MVSDIYGAAKYVALDVPKYYDKVWHVCFVQKLNS